MRTASLSPHSGMLTLPETSKRSSVPTVSAAEPSHSPSTGFLGTQLIAPAKELRPYCAFCGPLTISIRSRSIIEKSMLPCCCTCTPSTKVPTFWLRSVSAFCVRPRISGAGVVAPA